MNHTSYILHCFRRALFVAAYQHGSHDHLGRDDDYDGGDDFNMVILNMFVIQNHYHQNNNCVSNSKNYRNYIVYQHAAYVIINIRKSILSDDPASTAGFCFRIWGNLKKKEQEKPTQVRVLVGPGRLANDRSPTVLPKLGESLVNIEWEIINYLESLPEIINFSIMVHFTIITQNYSS